MQTRVYAYLVDPDFGDTTTFLAFGSLVDERLVVLHPGAAVRPDPRGPGLPDGLEAQDGPGLPDGPELMEASAAETVRLAPIGIGPPARCLLVDQIGLQVVDGHCLIDRRDPLGPPTAVRLVTASSCATDPMPLPPNIDASEEEILAAFRSYLGAASLEDPSVPPYPAPRQPPGPPDQVDPAPGRKPWYCSIWPGAPGCR